MNIRIAVILFILCLALPIVASAAVLHITQGDIVYYGDTVDCSGVVGFNNSVAWWATNHDPSAESPDHIIIIPDPHQFRINTTMEAGEWYQWEGYLERKAVVAFVVIAANRPYQPPTPTPTPVMLNTSIAPILQRTQPKALADILQARFDPLVITSDENATIWIFGPDTMVLGKKSTGIYYEKSFEKLVGTYTIFIQYPDANGIYEVYGDEKVINSTWKDVPAVDTSPLAPSLALDRFLAMISDAAHFHGRIKKMSMLVLNQMVDINYLDETDAGTIAVSGITTARLGSTLKVIFDEDKNVLTSDRARNTFIANVTGDDPGAYRIWTAFIKVNVNNLAPGEHWVSVYTAHGDRSQVPFRVYDQFAAFNPPQAHIKYINYSYFIPTPTPEIITKIVQQVVTVTIPVPVTPPYDTVLRAQEEAALDQRQALEVDILLAVLSVVLIYLGYRTGRYLVGVVKRARVQ